MLSIMVSLILVELLLYTFALSEAQTTNKDVDIKSLNEHIKKMDAELQEVKSHARVQEEQFSATLSSLLSQLAQNSHELMRSRNFTEELQQELQEMKKANNKTQIQLETVKKEVRSLEQDLQNCSTSCSKSDLSSHGFSKLNLTHAEVQTVVAEVLGQMHASGYIQLPASNQPLLLTDIGFEAYFGQAGTALPSDRIVFANVNHNEGHGYNKTTGYFTAPVSGTYLFWANIVYKSDKSAIVFYIETTKGILGRAYGRADEAFGTASVTSLFHLKKGEQTWIRSSVQVQLQAIYPTAGAVLIKQY